MQSKNTHKITYSLDHQTCHNWLLLQPLHAERQILTLPKCHALQYCKSNFCLSKPAWQSKRGQKFVWIYQEWWTFLKNCPLWQGVVSLTNLILEDSLLNSPSLLKHRRCQFLKKDGPFLALPNKHFRPSCIVRALTGNIAKWVKYDTFGGPDCTGRVAYRT